jgi:hypothetical protein
MNGPDTPEPNNKRPGAPRGRGVDSRGPVFLSHRRSDGGSVAHELAWELRGIGVPVWHDVTDLPLGDTRRRLEEALGEGLSGCVLIVTPEIQYSEVVRDIELPRLIELEEHSAFTFAIASTIDDDEGQLDYNAADHLLRPRKSLSAFLFLPAREIEEVTEVARRVAIQRMALANNEARAELVVDLQSRKPPAAGSDWSDLVIRTRPPREGEQVPPPEAWPPLRRGLSALPELVQRSGAKSILVRGGSHLAMAFAVGAALPDTAPWPVSVLDQFGNRWGGGCDGEAQALESSDQLLVSPDQVGMPAVFVDLVPSLEPADTFGRYVAGGRYISATRITLIGRPLMDASRGDVTMHEVADRIRSIAHDAGTNRVALFLRSPFAAAVLLGRLLNTLILDLYEWDGASDPPSYIRTVSVSSGHGGSPITNIHHINREVQP